MKKELKIMTCKGIGKNTVNKVANDRLEIQLKDNKGNQVYIELFGKEKNKRDEMAGIYLEYALGEGVGLVTDCTVNGVKANMCFGNFSYTDIGIIKFINKNFNTEFNGILIKNQFPLNQMVKLNRILPGGMYTDMVRLRG